MLKLISPTTRKFLICICSSHYIAMGQHWSGNKTGAAKSRASS